MHFSIQTCSNSLKRKKKTVARRVNFKPKSIDRSMGSFECVLGQRQTSQLDEIQWVVWWQWHCRLSRRIVATATGGVIDKASVAAAAEIIIGFVAQPLRGATQLNASYQCGTIGIFS